VTLPGGTTPARDPTTPFTRDVPLDLVTERILLSALRAHDAEAAAEVARARAEFLAAAGVRFGASLDEEVTRSAIAGLALPGLRGWCIVDVVEVTGGLRRLAVLHADAEKGEAADVLAHRWIPSAEDQIGVPAIIRGDQPRVITESVDEVVAATASDGDVLRLLRELGAGSLFVVPVLAHEALLGAITFVSHADASHFTAEDVALGQALAIRCGQALEAARLYAAAKAACAEADSARRDAEAARDEALQARAVAEEASQSKSVFLRTMSHELRTPLNAIGGYAQIIEMGVHGPVTPEQLVDLASIQRSQSHLLGMIEAVLHFARVETAHLAYDLRAIECAEVMAWAKTLVAPQARKRDLTLVFDECGEDMIVRADPQRFRQIAVNLLSNAVKFTKPGGRIEVSCARRGATITVAVRDTGIGIPPTHLESIFAPFVQVNSDLTRPHEGTGLGLAISREMARGMGGELSVESQLDRGSTFTLALPAA